MPVAELEVYPPASMNAQPNRAGRGAGNARHKAKQALRADLQRLLIAAGVPQPIPGDRVRATAVILFPTRRQRDEGNYRTGLEKALGDALAPAPTKAERLAGLQPLWRWLSDDSPPHFTFGAVTFGQTPIGWDGKRQAAVCTIRLVWGDELVAELERELAELRGS